MSPFALLFLAVLAALCFACQSTSEPSPTPPTPPARPPAADRLSARWTIEPPLPKAITNNAVASLKLDGVTVLFSFLGLDGSKVYTGITREAFRYNTRTEEWAAIRPVPGPVGRIAATAQGIGEKVYIFGGYTVDAKGEEVSLPNVDIYDPRTDSYTSGAPIPTPVDDAVSGVWRDRLIYLVSGWSQKENVPDVQVYDPQADRWQQATPIPGPPVFGHAGAVIGDLIVYCDGVKVDPSRHPRFVISDACYRGEIDPGQPTRIRWSKLPPHPGGPKYRMAAGVFLGQGMVVFTGGTANPYNYNGIGYNGAPSEPSSATFAYDVGEARWETMAGERPPTMDHRGLVGDGGELYLIGGMSRQQKVVNYVQRFSVSNHAMIEQD